VIKEREMNKVRERERDVLRGGERERKRGYIYTGRSTARNGEGMAGPDQRRGMLLL
jgi:hypothetical protein